MNETANTLVANGSLSAPSARISSQEALALAKTHYGIEGRVQRFDTEKDDTFRLTSRDGRNYTLKIANAAEHRQEISLQIDLLAHIALVNPGLPVPRVVADRDCRMQFSYADSTGQTREVHLLTYLEGVPLSEVTTEAHEREKVGEVLGTLRLAMAGYAHAADSREIAWDVKHLLKLAPLLDEIADPARRSLIETGLDRFTSIAGRLAKCRTQVLHNDFSKSNIVIDKSDAGFVTGIIDFGDAVRTAVVIDVSTALLNQLPSRPAEPFFAQGHDLLRGYLRVTDLTDEELLLLPHLVMGRAVARALLTIWRGRLFPDNARYIMRNTDQGWHQLAWFMARPINDISDEFLHTARRQRTAR
jgi:hydroxylysine kinase